VLIGLIHLHKRLKLKRNFEVVTVVAFLVTCAFITNALADKSEVNIPITAEQAFDSGNVIAAASGSPADIRTAFASAHLGDTIEIPAGTFTFDEMVDVTAGVYIKGAGRDETILQRSIDLGLPFFRVNGSNGEPLWMSGMTMIGDQEEGSASMDGGISLDNGCKDLRITQIEFRSFGQYGISVNDRNSVTGRSRGVVDNCRFIEIYRPAIANFGYGVVVNGDGALSWEAPLALGDQNAVFVEDCYFTANRHSVASTYGSRYVFRHNLVVDNGGEGAWVQAVDAHGPGYGSDRGSRSYEVYDNTINNINTTCWVAMYIRGGDGVIFNNQIFGGISTAPIMLTNDSGAGPWPALDQIRELHLWDNFYENEPTIATNWSTYAADGDGRIVQEGRDYFNYERPGYTPYAYPHPLRGSGSTPTNTAPVLASIGARSVDEAQTLSFTVSATDAEDDTLTYSYTATPSITGTTFNTATGAFSWTPQDGDAGTYSIEFSVTDGEFTDTETVIITVSQSNTDTPPTTSGSGGGGSGCFIHTSTR
jgi:hypothetical protein